MAWQSALIRATMNGRVRSAEAQRLIEEDGRDKNWKRWGTYLAERQWGTVREDYSPMATPGATFRTIWPAGALIAGARTDCSAGATGNAGLVFALALWNRKDPFIKERLCGLAGPEGNHGEDVKECYYYLDATPTHSYVEGPLQYPQAGVSLLHAD